jgi:hypothetical protein
MWPTYDLSVRTEVGRKSTTKCTCIITLLRRAVSFGMRYHVVERTRRRYIPEGVELYLTTAVGNSNPAYYIALAVAM